MSGSGGGAARRQQPSLIDSIKYLSAGAVAGAVSRTATAPLERLKIFNQIRGISANAARYQGIVHSLTLMYKEEGVVGFFKGNGVNCVKVVPASAIRFVSFENYKKLLLHDGEKNLTTTRKMIAGSCAGVTSVLFTYPLDLVRTRLSIQTTVRVYDGMFDAFQKIYRTEGMRGLFQGAGTSVTSVAPFAAVNFTVYETLKELGAVTFGSSNVFLSAGYGAASGSIAMTILYPLDVLKRRLQVQGHGEAQRRYKNGAHAAFIILKEEGIVGFYRGIIPSYLKVIPTVSLTWFSYEIMKNWFGMSIPAEQRKASIG